MNIWIKTIIVIIIYLVLIIALFFGLGGNWRWVEGWVFTFLFMLMSIAVMMAVKNNPKVLERRFVAIYQKGQGLSDKIIIALFFILYLAWLVIMPLDAQKFGWSPEFPLWLIIAGVIGFSISGVLSYYVYKQNAFLSPIIKKQEGQTLVSTGLYGVIRHPMYSAVSLFMISGALLLGSLYGIYIGIALTILLYIRTIFEERMLEKELSGYKEYKKRVKHRFIPYVF